MRALGNIIWFLLVGFWTALVWLFAGVLLCITIIGIPVGMQFIKFAHLTVLPFGKKVVTSFGAHPIANIVWILVGGLSMAVAQIVAGALLHITIIGIPFGKQCFKLASLAIAPFGAKVYD